MNFFSSNCRLVNFQNNIILYLYDEFFQFYTVFFKFSSPSLLRPIFHLLHKFRLAEDHRNFPLQVMLKVGYITILFEYNSDRLLVQSWRHIICTIYQTVTSTVSKCPTSRAVCVLDVPLGILD